MTTLSATKARDNLYNLIDEVSASGKRIGITNNGETKAILISAEELSALEATLDIISDPKMMQAIKESEEDIKAGRIVTWEEVKKSLNLDVSSNSNKKSRKGSKKDR